MNAIQFIKEHGVDKAREVVKCAPKYSKHVIPCLDGEMYFAQREDGTWFKYSNGYGKWLEYFGKCNPLDLAYELSDIKRLVESVDIISKFDSVQEAKDAISNSPDGATDYRKLSCTIRYIKQSERFFEYWDGFNWCRPTVPFTDETHILRFTQLSRLEQAIADCEAIYGGEHV